MIERDVKFNISEMIKRNMINPMYLFDGIVDKSKEIHMILAKEVNDHFILEGLPLMNATKGIRKDSGYYIYEWQLIAKAFKEKNHRKILSIAPFTDKRFESIEDLIMHYCSDDKVDMYLKRFQTEFGNIFKEIIPKTEEPLSNKKKSIVSYKI